MKVLIIGGGNMGQTFAHSFVRSPLVTKEDILILEKNDDRAQWLTEADMGTIYQNPEDCLPQADLIILAVKPQDILLLFSGLRPMVHPDQVYLSIMAGVKIETIKDGLGTGKVVRAMPNLPAQIGLGMTAYTSSDAVSSDEQTMIQSLLNTTGSAINVTEEKMLDATTGISGSGTAYVYYCMQAFIDAGEKMGFTPEEAKLLTWQTFKGAVELFDQNDLSCTEWMQRVASPNGTTEAALRYFDNHDVAKHLQGGAEAARKRAEELGGN